MKLVFNCIILIWITVPYVLSGQIENADSTKPSSLIIYCNDRDDTIEKPIHLDWVKMDVELIINILNKLPANGSTLNEIKKIIPDFVVPGHYSSQFNCLNSTQDLGYGLRSTLCTIHGGYGYCRVDAVYFGDNVLKLRLTISNNREILEKYLMEVIQLPFYCSNEHIIYEKTYQENIKKYFIDSGKVFVGSDDTNYRRKQAIDYFTDVMTGGTFTEPYYIMFGLGNETFNHLRYFIVNKDYDALETILFSPSPTSRLFAAITLLYMKDKFGYQPADKTNERIRETMANAQLIRSGILSCWVNKFKFDYFDVVNNFEKYLQTE